MCTATRQRKRASWFSFFNLLTRALLACTAPASKVLNRQPRNVYEPMPVSKWDIYEYLGKLKDNIDEMRGKHKSNKVRQFICDFKELHSLNEVSIITMYNEFCAAHSEVQMKDTYFKTICEKKWETHPVVNIVDGKKVRTIMINLNKEKRKS